MALAWHRVPEKFCNGNSACAEIAQAPNGDVYLRTTAIASAVVVMTGPEWAAFKNAVKAGEFDELTQRLPPVQPVDALS